ncbi:MAG: serine protease [Bacteroidota bacterium]
MSPGDRNNGPALQIAEPQDSVERTIQPPANLEAFYQEQGWRSGRIVGGSDAIIEDYPWQVAILTSSNQQFCGGSIINERWILTAAHCIGVYSNIRIRAGVTNITDPGQTITVEQQIVHPDYQSINNYDHDIALLYLSAPLDLSGASARAIPIMTQALADEGFDAPGVMSTITGWGALSWQGNATNILQAAQVPITDNIGSYSPSQITPDMLLAGYSQGGIDACQGDSGGPLTVPDGEGYWYLAGITSWGNGCAFPNYPGAYARVSYFENWIKQYVPLNDPESPGPPASLSVMPDVSGLLTANVSWYNPTVTFAGEILDEITMVKLFRNGEEIFSQADPTPGSLMGYADETVAMAGMYCYSVKAFNSAGDGVAVSMNAYVGEAGILVREPFDYPSGQLPPGWELQGDVSHSWSVSNSFNAGGTAPELHLYWNPPATGTSRLVSYPIPLFGQPELTLKLKQFLDNYEVTNEDEVVAIDVSFGETKSWITLWEEEVDADVPQGEYEFTVMIPEGATVMHLGFRFQGNTFNINDWFIDDLVLEYDPPQLLDVSIIVEGAYSPGQPFLMETSLASGGYVPLAQPYGPDLPWFGNAQPLWYYQGNETLLSIPEMMVDWILLEFREAPSAATATAATMVYQMPALLLRNGKVANTNLLPLLLFEPLDDLFLVVHHRNHLSVMSSGQLSLSGGVYSWDFTSGAGQAHLQGQKHMGDGVYAMYGGDGDGNGQVQTQDKNEVWNLQAGQSGYHAGDFDLNGQVQTQDKNEIWNSNSGVATQVP